MLWLEAPYFLKLHEFVLPEPFLILQLTTLHPLIVGIVAQLWTDVALFKIFSDERISLLFLMNLQEISNLINRFLGQVD